MTGRRLATLLVVVAFVTGCTGAALSGSVGPASAVAPSATRTPAASAEAVELTVYGAASLKGALDAIKSAYATAAPDVTLTVATDASSTLRTQIEQGAPADVFLSADQTNPKTLVDKGLADGAAVDFAGNTLTVIVPAANRAGIAKPADLARSGVKVIAAGDDVPIAKYTTQVVANLAGLGGYPAGFAAAYDANVVSKEDNVKAAVAKIELGEGDAAIVYSTDAKASTKVTTVSIPTEANVPATYAGVVVKASPNVAIAHAFLSWLAGPDGQAVLSTFGFLPPS
jgi:molybdate transport system substrate-binding protein